MHFQTCLVISKKPESIFIQMCLGVHSITQSQCETVTNSQLSAYFLLIFLKFVKYGYKYWNNVAILAHMKTKKKFQSVHKKLHHLNLKWNSNASSFSRNNQNCAQYVST